MWRAYICGWWAVWWISDLYWCLQKYIYIFVFIYMINFFIGVICCWVAAMLDGHWWICLTSVFLIS